MTQRIDIAIAMIMGMCMWSCRMRMDRCAYLSSVISVSRANRCVAETLA